MSDDKTNTGPGDAQRINVNEDYEVAYWTRKWRVHESELRAAVARVGVSVEAVRRELGK